MPMPAYAGEMSPDITGDLNPLHNTDIVAKFQFIAFMLNAYLLGTKTAPKLCGNGSAEIEKLDPILNRLVCETNGTGKTSS